MTAGTPADDAGEVVTEARRALNALRLEVPAVVADDVSRLVEAAFAESQAVIDGLRTVIAVRYARLERVLAISDEARTEADNLRVTLAAVTCTVCDEVILPEVDATPDGDRWAHRDCMEAGE